ncbi:polyribonucleotide nucleotidyltransferase [Leptospira santarosai]|uniref:polyribonucleotide nucleotidyltransferase n=1 Tax=Leptospira santarosai TaxID=28183 RepID=UPI000297239B|nr:polyribonucleotide nucleotidyltransferase [Leptospira santarosai]EKR93241.1 polyribonucleotide nucleotidyltransferase [Leptospira santarosai str. CBC379]EMO24466.1 polyribonucleotide nucleotidyltransferase [Leptospira santarosai str. HAI134]MDI7172509.1 polyribonucleotide nucleotidyltransferase [Leptospira santarosai]MDI7192308.1 polyribonucleotide nucleotidyltransferase [Leptospira santarosai]MDO6396562.1 polyribonucleotide nucleotidyltransferase [Leptospira santarosai]
MTHTISGQYGRDTIVLETGSWAKQAHGAVVYKSGNLVLLATVCAADDAKEGQDFFPLTCEYTEKLYSVGRFPGGYFKREAKPPEHEILISRIIDRPIRPLFPEGYFCEVQLQVQVLSADGEVSVAGHALNAASAALTISDIPFNGPIAGARIGRINGELILNPTTKEIANSDLDLVVAGTKTHIVMIEGEAKELSNEEMLSALRFAQKHIAEFVTLQEEYSKRIGVVKREVKLKVRDSDLLAKVKEYAFAKLTAANQTPDKTSRNKEISNINKEVVEFFKQTVEEEDKIKDIKTYLHELEYEIVREQVLTKGTRFDGRKLDEIRPISVEINPLPGPHGSSVFTRGQTQSLGVVTLGTGSDNQRYETLEGQKEKSFMLHYNFPAFSVGEVRRSSGPGRREIGHGNLAERALKLVLPKSEEFPYVIRVVSEILESNGSSSMASVCSGSLALMAAGVPIKGSVSGIAMGLFSDSSGKYAVLSDIAGLEDHFGDMDCKIAGTRKGITAFQMDLKVTGVSFDVLESVFEQAQRGRFHILDIMEKHISKASDSLAGTAPRVIVRNIPKDRIGELIGPGGKNVRGISELTGAELYIEDDGKVTISGSNQESAEKAAKMVDGFFAEVEVGKIYEGKVKRIADFGAFVEILPGKEGLCHISKIDFKRVNSVKDIVKEGDVIRVKVLNVDKTGKIDLSRKDALEEEQV